VPRLDLTDAEWAVIEPLLPTDVRDKERVDDRRVPSGMRHRRQIAIRFASELSVVSSFR
jgi:transposase